ncbi:MAG: glycosyltransferase family 4 protein [Chthoniobacterales bacterium]
MNYLLVNYEYPPVGAGAATATKAIAHALGSAGHEVLVLTGAYAGEPPHSTEDRVTVHRLSCRRARRDRSNVREMLSFLRAGLVALPRLLRQHNIGAAIIFFSFPCGPIGLVARILKRIPYVIALRGGDVPGAEPGLAMTHRLLQPLRRYILRRSVAVVANSNGLRKMAALADPIPVRVIPNGVDTEFFHPAAHRPISDRFRVTFAGRFQAQKNLGVLLEQFAQLRDKAARHVELHLVGDGPLITEMRAHAAKLRLNSEITWHGWLAPEALREVLQSSDCFVNPSHYEGMPNAVLEAMACGKPIIASRVAGHEDLVIDGETGFLFSLDAPAELAGALRMLSDNPARAWQMGENGRDFVKRNFSWSRVAAAYANLFEPKANSAGVGTETIVNRLESTKEFAGAEASSVHLPGSN